MKNKPIEIVELEDDVVIDTTKPISKKELTEKLQVNKNYLYRFFLVSYCCFYDRARYARSF